MVGMALKSNWEFLVQPADEHQLVRPCVLCGDMQARTRKLVPTSWFREIVSASCNIFAETTYSMTFDNICSALESIDADDTHCICCINCYYWTSRHKEIALLPLLHLKLYINTMHLGGYKCFDRRGLHRLCCTLGQQHAGYYNFYRTLFSEAELDLAQRVADSPVKNIIDIIVQFIQEQSANSFFFLDKAVVQRIRKL